MKYKGSAFSSFIISAIIILVVLFVGGYIFVCEILWWCPPASIISDVSSIQDTIKNAAQSPNGTVFTTKNVVIPKDYSFSTKQFSQILNINEECVELDFSPALSSAEYLTENKFSLKFNEKTVTDFYIMCQTEDCIGSCNEFCCIAAFGKNLEMQNWLEKIN